MKEIKLKGLTRENVYLKTMLTKGNYYKVVELVKDGSYVLPTQTKKELEHQIKELKEKEGINFELIDDEPFYKRFKRSRVSPLFIASIGNTNLLKTLSEDNLISIYLPYYEVSCETKLTSLLNSLKKEDTKEKPTIILFLKDYPVLNINRCELMDIFDNANVIAITYLNLVKLKDKTKEIVDYIISKSGLVLSCAFPNKSFNDGIMKISFDMFLLSSEKIFILNVNPNEPDDDLLLFTPELKGKVKPTFL